MVCRLNFYRHAVRAIGIAVLAVCAAAPLKAETLVIAPGYGCHWNETAYELVQLSSRDPHAITKVFSNKKLKAGKKKLRKLKRVQKLMRSRKQKQEIKKWSKILAFNKECGRQAPPSLPPPAEPPSTPCNLAPGGFTFETAEGQEQELTLPSAGCGEKAEYRAFAYPEHGSLSVLSSGAARYRSRFNVESDSFSYVVCDAETSQCGPAQPVSVTIARGGDFGGLAESLEPYRQELSEEEKVHIVQKLALNNRALLDEATLDMTLDQFLEQRLFNFEWVAPDLKSSLERIRDRQAAFQRPNTSMLEEFIRPEAHWPATQGTWTLFFPTNRTFETPLEQLDALNQLLMVSTREVHGDFFKYYWANDLITGYLLTRARYESPLRILLLHFWLGHLGVTSNTVSGDREVIIGRYFKTVENNALGSFRRMMVGAAPQGCGGWQNGTSGLICDFLANFYLDNQLNTGTSPNENFARELMELFTLGPNNLEIGRPNYNDVTDVAWATNFLSGYEVMYGPGYSDYMRYNPARHSTTPRTAFAALGQYFPSLPIVQKSLTPQQFTNHLFNHHPGVRYFIARRLFSQLVYPNPPQSIVDELAADLLESDYDIMPVLKKIARSEAFFSARAREKDCFEEPFKLYARVINGLQLPMLNHGSGGAFSLYQRNLTRTLTRQSGAGGETVMGWPTIFSLDYCGRAPDKDGSGEWLKSSRLLGRITGMITFLNYHGMDTHNDFSYAGLLNGIGGPYTPQVEDRQTPRKEEVMDYMAAVLGTEASADEREIIDWYLSNNLGGDLAPTAIPWNPSNITLMNQKMTGLIAIFAGLPASNLN